MTKKAIEYNLSISPYKEIVGDYMFHFSSDFYRRKFNDEYKEYKDKINSRLYSALGFSVLIREEVYAVSLYGRIEKRGYLVTDLSEDLEIRSKDGFSFVLLERY